MWSSCPWLRKIPSTLRRGSSRYEISGRTRSMPSMSSWGNMSPASTTRTWSSHSSAHMLMPTSPRPQSGSWVVKRHVRHAIAPHEAAVDPRYGALSRQQALKGMPAEHEHDLRLDHLQLAGQVRRARFDLVRHRVAVLRWPA